jgi:CBS domain-containing protein
MAAAGPATSLAIGVVGLATANFTALLGLPELAVRAVAWLAGVNLVLGVFNLAPAFPLDGGRILRALLWRHHGDRLRATATAARWGTGFGYVLFGLGVLSLIQGAALNGLWFWLLGMFVLDAARSELRITAQHDLLGDLRVGDLMTPDPLTVPPEVTLTELIDRYVLAERHSAYPVVDDGRPTGLISLTELRAVPRAARATTLVAQAARPLADVPTARSGDPLTDLLDRLTATGAARALVVDDGRLVGILSLTDVARALDVRASTRGIPVG